jgi:hypothetical protein
MPRQRLRDGGSTQPIKTERREYPRPRTRVEVRYKDGQWEKLLARKGWIPA